MEEILKEIFKRLNELIEAENTERRDSGARLLEKAKVTILGQTSLLVQKELTFMLSLAQTGDLDAKLDADFLVKKCLKEILPEYGLIYDEDSEFIFIPKQSRFKSFINLPYLEVELIDPESALVSKAVKAPEKNLQLIRQAILSDQFPNLSQRIIDNGGDLKKFT